MDFMKPVLRSELPAGDRWVYEMKYDGFRCMLLLDKRRIQLLSKSGKDLTAKFPEIIQACEELQSVNKSHPSIVLDGELVVLNNEFTANFSLIQQRGRLRNEDKIKEASLTRPATFAAFDMLSFKGDNLKHETFVKRRKQLVSWFEDKNPPERFMLVRQFTNAEEIQELSFDYKTEGIIAKKMTSIYSIGKQHKDWYKVKNWRTVHCLLNEWDAINDYFQACVYEPDGSLVAIGKVKHGLDAETFQIVKQAFIQNGKQKGNVYSLPPAICAEVHTLGLYSGELREPNFTRILQGEDPLAVNRKRLEHDLAMLPDSFDLSNPEKIFWPDSQLKKEDLVTYIRNVSPYMLPFLRDKALTLIRYPEGVEGESFFQKHLPPYAPDIFPEMLDDEGERRIICNRTLPLLWFANHGAIEYHMPFNRARDEYPVEIVFDLDPPDRKHFHLAVQAAVLIKQMTDELGLITFVKTSGSKGLQIHIPLPNESLSYDDTAICTKAIALTVERLRPELFTTERLKKNRKGRLYLDYVQHAPGKTIIAPYSPRRVREAAVATPLFWEEVTESLRIEQFTIRNIIERIELLGCPFANYEKTGEQQDLTKLRKLIRGLSED